MTLVLDEWVWADLRCENGEERMRETERLLREIHNRCDRIVVIEGSPFARKFYHFFKQASSGEQKAIAWLLKEFLVHSCKVKKLLPEPGHANSDLLAPVNPDDAYLVEAYDRGQADLLVTTDEPLAKLLKDRGYDVRLRDPFIQEYLRGR